MLIREGNKIKVLMNSIFESDDKDKGKESDKNNSKVIIKKSDVRDILKNISVDLKKDIQSSIVKFYNKKENYFYEDDLCDFDKEERVEGLLDNILKTFNIGKKAKVENWLENITKDIQSILSVNNFYSKKPEYSGGSYIFYFGDVDDDGRVESSAISVIETYLKDASKVPEIIESSPKENRVNNDIVSKVKSCIRKHVSVSQFMLFFAITRVENNDSDIVGLTLGVATPKENMSGLNGDLKGSVKSSKWYHYYMSSIYINLDVVVGLELEVPKYLEQLLQLRNKKKIKGYSRSASSGKFVSKLKILRDKYKGVSDKSSKSSKPDTFFNKLDSKDSKNDQFYAIIDKIEKMGGYNNVDVGDNVSKEDLKKFIPYLVDNIFDEDLEKLRKKIGDSKFKNLTKDEKTASELSPEHVIELLKYIKDGTYNGDFLGMYNDNMFEKEKAQKGNTKKPSRNAMFRAPKNKSSDDSTVATNKSKTSIKTKAPTKMSAKTKVK